MDVLSLLNLTTVGQQVVKFVRENGHINQAHQKNMMEIIHLKLMEGRDTPVK